MQRNAKTKKTILGVFALMLCVSACYVVRGVEVAPVVYPTEDFSQDTAYSVLEIINGNTVQIEYGDKPTTIRLIGVDISEIPQSKSVEEDSKEALVFARNLLLGESVYLRFDGLDQMARHSS